MLHTMIQATQSTMKAIALDRFGGLETMKLQMLPVPEVGPNEVLITAGGPAANKALTAMRAGGRVAYPNSVEPRPKPPFGIDARSYDGMPDPQAIEKLNCLIESSGPPGTRPFEVHVARSFPLDRPPKRIGRLMSTILASLSCKRLSVSVTGVTSMMKEEFHVQAIERSQPRARSWDAGPAFLLAGMGVTALLQRRTSMATILIDKNVMVPMRDGVLLATDVYRLDGATPAPVIITRTPYDKERAVAGSDTFDILRAVQAGYAVVIQDVRGRYASEGEFDPMIHETRDGVDTFAWAAAQPWSRGVVGTFGGSYLGATQWLPAREQPPALRAMAPAVTFSDMYEGSAYQGGAKVLHDVRWVVEDIIPGEIRRRVARGGESPEGGARLDLDAVLSHLPLADHPLIRDAAAFYFDRLAHPTADAYWHPISPCAGYEQISAPALNISGWYDIFLWGTFQNYQGMRQRGGTEHARRNQRVIIGPWTHSNFTASFPEREFGAAASSGRA